MLPRMVEGDAVGSIYERKDQPVPALKPAAAPASPRETAGGPTRPRRIRLSSRSRYRSADASRRERRPSRRKRRKAVIFWFLVVGLAGVLFTGVLLAVVLWAASSVVDASGVEPVAHLVTEQIITLLRESFVGRSVTGMIGAACVALVGVIGAVVRSRMVTYH